MKNVYLTVEYERIDKRKDNDCSGKRLGDADRAVLKGEIAEYMGDHQHHRSYGKEAEVTHAFMPYLLPLLIALAWAVGILILLMLAG